MGSIRAGVDERMKTVGSLQAWLFWGGGVGAFLSLLGGVESSVALSVVWGCSFVSLGIRYVLCLLSEPSFGCDGFALVARRK